MIVVLSLTGNDIISFYNVSYFNRPRKDHQILLKQQDLLWSGIPFDLLNLVQFYFISLTTNDIISLIWCVTILFHLLDPLSVRFDSSD